MYPTLLKKLNCGNISIEGSFHIYLFPFFTETFGWKFDYYPVFVVLVNRVSHVKDLLSVVGEYVLVPEVVHHGLPTVFVGG